MTSRGPFRPKIFYDSMIITLWNKRELVESVTCMLHKTWKEEAVIHISGLRHSAYCRWTDGLHLLFSLSVASLHGPGSHISLLHTEPFHLALQDYSSMHWICLAQVFETQVTSYSANTMQRRLFTKCWHSHFQLLYTSKQQLHESYCT